MFPFFAAASTHRSMRMFTEGKHFIDQFKNVRVAACTYYNLSYAIRHNRNIKERFGWMLDGFIGKIIWQLIGPRALWYREKKLNLIQFKSINGLCGVSACVCVCPSAHMNRQNWYKSKISLNRARNRQFPIEWHALTNHC